MGCEQCKRSHACRFCFQNNVSGHRIVPLLYAMQIVFRNGYFTVLLERFANYSKKLLVYSYLSAMSLQCITRCIIERVLCSVMNDC